MKKIFLAASLLVLAGCMTMLKRFHYVENSKASWSKEVKEIMLPIQGEYFTMFCDEEFNIRFKDKGFKIAGNLISGYGEGEDFRIKEIRHERTFVDFIERRSEIFIFLDKNKKEYHLYYFLDGTLEIVTPERWSVYKRKSD